MSWIQALVPYKVAPVTQHGAHEDKNKNVRDDDQDGQEGFKSPGRRAKAWKISSFWG